MFEIQRLKESSMDHEQLIKSLNKFGPITRIIRDKCLPSYYYVMLGDVNELGVLHIGEDPQTYDQILKAKYSSERLKAI